MKSNTLGLRTKLSVESLEDRCTPAVFTVTNPTDGPIANMVNLREAITAANTAAGVDSIDFAPGAYDANGDLTVRLNSALPKITEGVSISTAANLAPVTITRASGAPNFRILEIDLSAVAAGPGKLVQLTKLALVSGRAEGQDNKGGGLKSTDANVSMNDCQVRLNTATGDGGGIWATGPANAATTFQIRGSAPAAVLIDQNSSLGNGGGICSLNTFMEIQQNAAITANHAGGSGGGVAAFGNNYTGLRILEIKVSLVNYNECLVGDGGGVFSQNVGGPLVQVDLTTSTITANIAWGTVQNGVLVSGGRGGGYATVGLVNAFSNAATTIEYNGQRATAALPNKLGLYRDPLTGGNFLADVTATNYLILITNPGGGGGGPE